MVLVDIDIRELALKALEQSSRKDSFSGFVIQLILESFECWNLRNLDEALVKCDDAIKLTPDWRFLKIFKALILSTGEDYFDSESFLSDIEKDNLDTIENQLYLFITSLNHFYLNHFSESIKYCDEFLRLKQSDADGKCGIHFLRGCAHASLEKHKIAISDFKKSLKAKWEVEAIRANLAYSYLRNKNYFKAWFIYRKTVKHFPDHWKIQYNTGLSYGNLGMFSKAMPYLNRTEELNPEFSGTYLTRGFIFFKRGERQLAIKDWERAKELGAEKNYQMILKKYLNK